MVKVLMGLGVSRNEANQIAVRYRTIGIPYREAVLDYAFGFGSTSREDFLDFLEYTWVSAKKYRQNGETLIEGYLAMGRELFYE